MEEGRAKSARAFERNSIGNVKEKGRNYWKVNEGKKSIQSKNYLSWKQNIPSFQCRIAEPMMKWNFMKVFIAAVQQWEMDLRKK